MNNKQDKNWWERNWKWLVPVGCLTSFALFAGVIVLIMTMIFGLMKSSDVYRDALVMAKEHPVVQQTIGTPIEEGMFVSGNINVNGSSGEADLSIPVSGPSGKATIYLVAEKSAGQWIFSTLVVEIKGSRQRINLLAYKAVDGKK